MSRGYVAVSKKSEKNRENHFRKMKILQLLETGDISAEWALIFLKIQSKHRQVISSKFPKNFRGAGDLVVF